MLFSISGTVLVTSLFGWAMLGILNQVNKRRDREEKEKEMTEAFKKA